MADKRDAEEEHCTTPRGALQRQPERRKIVTTSPLSDTARRLLLVKCSAADQQETTAFSVFAVFSFFRFSPLHCLACCLFSLYFPSSCRFVSWSFHGARGARLGELWTRLNARALYDAATFNLMNFAWCHIRVGVKAIFSNNKDFDVCMRCMPSPLYTPLL